MKVIKSILYVTTVLNLSFLTTGGLVPQTTFLRAPFLDKAIVHTERLGGSFAYSTSELLAYTPIFYGGSFPVPTVNLLLIPALRPGFGAAVPMPPLEVPQTSQEETFNENEVHFPANDVELLPVDNGNDEDVGGDDEAVLVGEV